MPRDSVTASSLSTHRTFGILGLLPLLLLSLLLLGPLATELDAASASLRPTRSALLRQVDAARQHGFSHASNSTEVRSLLRRGLLERVRSNPDFHLKDGMSFPYARPEVARFLERLAAPYREVCGEPLVVTSLIRPKSHQPRNSSPLSVHPTGMAMDLRLSWRRSCRAWLEGVLLDLEDAGVLEAARERRPPHYHVVLFPLPYQRYVADLPEDRIRPDRGHHSYRVQRGDNLWRIARHHGTTVERIRSANGMRSTVIRPGQVLAIPND